MIGVWDETSRYHSAISELPFTVRRSVTPEGSIAVVDGDDPDWREVSSTLTCQGALAVVVDRPRVIEASNVSEGAANLHAVPVVLRRPSLRPDIAARIEPIRSGLLVGTCISPSRGQREAMVDAVGWLRILGGGELEVDRVQRSADVLSALFVGTTPASLSVVAPANSIASPRVRVTAITERRQDLIVASGRIDLITTDQGGETKLARRFESAERLALRRILHALESTVPVTDVDEFVRDSRVVDGLLDTLVVS